MKRQKVILIIIDSLHPEALGYCLHTRSVPGLAFLINNGRFYDRCISCFPTMTPTATASIATGAWADEHGIPGFIWYDGQQDCCINYGATAEAVLKLKPWNVLENLIHSLNKRQLSRKLKTVYEAVESNGLISACINFFIHRGQVTHSGSLPWVIKLGGLFRLQAELKGPGILSLGSLHRPEGIPGELYWGVSWPWRRFGVNDEVSGRVASHLISSGRQPDFMLVYLPDTDKYSHVYGPRRSQRSIRRADLQIQKILNAYPSWEQALKENIFIVAGDHSQSEVGWRRSSLIFLEKILARFHRRHMLDRPHPDQELMLCPNERSAAVYFLYHKEHLLPEVVEELARDERIAQIIWKEAEWYRVREGGSSRCLKFKRGGPYRDDYNLDWDFEGDLDVVGGLVTAEQQLVYGEYPDALRRIQSGIDSRNEPRVLLSARPSFEFHAEGAPTHRGGGSHGSLHAGDSVVPLVIGGTDREINNPRIIDFYPFIMEHFGITPLPKTT